jgi:hypothetical protein
VPEFWDYLYLHTGDILRVASTGARLGRKSSNQKSLDVDDDLPGERLKMASSYNKGRGILTMPHGARAVPVVLPIQSDNLIEGGERPAFQPDAQMKKIAKSHELESGTILVEDSIFVKLSDFDFEAMVDIVKKAQSKRLVIREIEKPNLKGLCSDQRFSRLRAWEIRNAKFGISVDISEKDYDEIESVLRAMGQTSGLFGYLDTYLLDILETRLMFDSIKILNDRTISLVHRESEWRKFLDKFARHFEHLERKSGNQWQSGFIVPTARNPDNQFRNIEEMLDRLELDSLKPFIAALEMGPKKGRLKVEDWFKLLSLLRSVIPSLKDLGWTNETEGNDLMMHDQFHKNLRAAVLIDFFPFIVKQFHGPKVDPSMQHLGIQLQEGGVYRRGHRVVCDRIRRNTERSITAWLELYDNKGNLVSSDKVGNHADLTHGQKELDYTNCEWLVIRIGRGQHDISADDFNGLLHHGDYCPGCDYEHDSWTPNSEIASPIGDVWTCDNCGYSDVRRMSTDEEWEEHQNPNPFEAFVTLPWFIRLDNERLHRKKEVGRRGVGILGEDSRQLVHVHFTETVSSSQGDSVAIIPLCVEEGETGLKPLHKDRKSFTTICFRAMFSTSLDEERGMSDREDVADPGSAWWVERPST